MKHVKIKNNHSVPIENEITIIDTRNYIVPRSIVSLIGFYWLNKISTTIPYNFQHKLFQKQRNLFVIRYTVWFIFTLVNRGITSNKIYSLVTMIFWSFFTYLIELLVQRKTMHKRIKRYFENQKHLCLEFPGNPPSFSFFIIMIIVRIDTNTMWKPPKIFSFSSPFFPIDHQLMTTALKFFIFEKKSHSTRKKSYL